jgi:hypothetical protein
MNTNQWRYLAPVIAGALAWACADTVAPIRQAAPHAAGTLAIGPLTGAVWTSTAGCAAIDHNIYGTAQDVFVNGGPQGNVALNDGDYYVQVTTPAGDLLGTSVGRTGGEDTPFHVLNGQANCAELWLIVDKASTIGTGLTRETGYDPSSQTGEYKFWVSNSADFADQKTDNFRLRQNPCSDNCGPNPSGLLTVQKFYDLNGDGQFDGSDSYLTGWEFQVTGSGFLTTGFTDAGVPATVDLLTGSYTVAEGTPTIPAGAQQIWYHSTLASVPVASANGEVTPPTVTFGNFCVAPPTGNALTLGAYSGGNRTYQAFVTSELGAIAGGVPHIFNTAGTNMNPFTSAKAVSNYLLGSTATNMANMLSAQLLTMWFNTQWSPPKTNSGYLYAPQLHGYAVPGLSSGDVISVTDLIAAANADLALAGHNVTLSGSTSRAYQEALKTVLDNGNNNLNWVSATAAGGCAVPTSFTF